MDYQKLFRNFDCICALDFPKTHKMQATIYKFSDNSSWVVPVNGCEFSNGNPKCSKCAMKITEIFNDNPDLFIDKPLNPFSLTI